ncbi:hypothetical protein [Mangrovibrevibacter kandeliae]|nr:hypothetical protein [Aurantimonas sp. CSK15Z-1]MCQ8782354.1 hypothetical protein [Aurantimonas sp. CSK15Z-1]
MKAKTESDKRDDRTTPMKAQDEHKATTHPEIRKEMETGPQHKGDTPDA